MGLDSVEKLDVIKGLRQMGYGGCFATAIKDMEHKLANGGFIKTRAPQRYVGGVHQDRENRSALMEGDLAQYEANTQGVFDKGGLL